MKKFVLWMIRVFKLDIPTEDCNKSSGETSIDPG